MKFTLLLMVQFIIQVKYITVLCTSSPITTTTTTTSRPSTTKTITLILPEQISYNNSNATKTIAIKTSSTSYNNNVTPTRTIQRLVGGHLLHATDTTTPSTTTATSSSSSRRTTTTTPATTTTTTQNSVANINSKIYFRRKNGVQPQLIQTRQTPSSSTYKYNNNRNRIRESIYNRDALDDTLLLESDNKIDNWDSGILRSSAGAGKETNNNNNKKEESKKTLSDQVKEGKYGLIEKELFEKQPKRPGIVSYLDNPDVIKDTSKNYGGLKADDIWLAEDHLLVLKGGNLNKENNEDDWKPIDDYEAPRRQVKIPENPKVPPPFPVQFEDNGPIQFIGNNQFPFYNPFPNESLLLFANGKPQEENPYNQNQKNNFAGHGTPENFTNNDKGYQYPTPPQIPPWLHNNNNETFTNPFLNMPPFGPYPYPNGSFPNFTEPFDEDDPAFYYPPPYSFIYKSNYTNAVPPGPLVPGIILPPPPNFFARLKEKHSTTSAPQVTKLYRQQLKPVHSRVQTSTTTTTHQPPPLRFIPREKVNDNNVIQTYKPYVSELRPTKQTSYRTTTKNPVTTLKKVVTPSNILSFVPKISPPENNVVFNKANPVYYEYFDARVGAQKPTFDPYAPPSISNVKVTELKSTVPPVYQNTVTPTYREKIQRTRPFIQSTYIPVKQYDYDKYIYITPKPEIKPNGIATNYGPADEIEQNLTFKPIFDQEVETIKQTLQYYQNGGQQQQSPYSTQVPRTPKAKGGVYEYTYEPNSVTTKKPFQSSTVQFDSTPFKPMVQYSVPFNENEFKASLPSYTASVRLEPTTELPNNYYTTTGSIDIPVTYNQPKFVQRQEHSLRISPVPQQQNNRPTQRYLPYQQQTAYRTSTENPLPYYTQKDSILFDDITKKYFNTFGQKINSGGVEITESTSPANRQKPWLSIEKQVIHELQQRPSSPQSQRNNYPSGYIRNGANIRNIDGGAGNGGYHYDNPEQNKNSGPSSNGGGGYYTYGNGNNEEFTKQVQSIRSQIRYPINQQQQQPPQQQQQQQQYHINLINDTYINYRQPRPPINPDVEYLSPHREHYSTQQPIINQYYTNRQPLPQQPPQSQQQIPIGNLHRDTLINYKYPLPPINPDSEFILPHQLQNQEQQQQPPNKYRLQNYGGGQNPPVIQYRLPGDQAHVYFITPRELKYTNNNNNKK